MSQSLNTKEKILQSAIQIFSENGFHGTKVSNIVANAKLSQGTFYNYFTNKDECFEVILKKMHTQTVEQMYEIINENHSDEIIFYLSKIFFEKLYEHRLIAKIFMFEARSNSNRFQKLFYEFKKNLNDLFKTAITKRYGDVKNLDIKMLIFTGTIQEIIENKLLLDCDSFERIMETLKEAIDEIFGELYEKLH
jgi:AcrR family transcriptional regulator